MKTFGAYLVAFPVMIMAGLAFGWLITLAAELTLAMR